jgi:hypothetical protein
LLIGRDSESPQKGVFFVGEHQVFFVWIKGEIDCVNAALNNGAWVDNEFSYARACVYSPYLVYKGYFALVPVVWVLSWWY